MCHKSPKWAATSRTFHASHSDCTTRRKSASRGSRRGSYVRPRPTAKHRSRTRVWHRWRWTVLTRCGLGFFRDLPASLAGSSAHLSGAADGIRTSDLAHRIQVLSAPQSGPRKTAEPSARKLSAPASAPQRGRSDLRIPYRLCARVPACNRTIGLALREHHSPVRRPLGTPVPRRARGKRLVPPTGFEPVTRGLEACPMAAHELTK